MNIYGDNGVKIPIGGSDEWELIKHIVVEEEVSSIRVNTDKDGNPFSLKKILIFGSRAMPEAGTQNYCYFRGTDGSSVPAYGNGINLGGVNQGAGNSAGSVRYFVSKTENITHGHDINVWQRTSSLSANETSSNSGVYPTGTSEVSCTNMNNNNSKLNFTDNCQTMKTIKDIALATYSGVCWGVGSEIYIMGVRE